MTLIVIPVRSGSVGIPRKAVRLLGGVSPLARTIRTAQYIGCATVVTTDDEEAYTLAQRYGVQAVMQPPNVSAPDSPLDAAVAFATSYMERLVYPLHYQTVVTLQCTSPFTSVDTVRRAIAISEEQGTTVVTVRDDRGLRWESCHTERNVIASRAPRRVTRQHMPPCWRETGAVFVTPRQWVEPTSRFSHTAYLLEVTGREAVDLDTLEDWWIAERYAELETVEQAA